MAEKPTPDFTSPIAGRIEVRVPCAWCGDRQMIPRHQFDEHVMRLHPDVKTGERRAAASSAPADQAADLDRAHREAFRLASEITRLRDRNRTLERVSDANTLLTELLQRTEAELERLRADRAAVIAEVLPAWEAVYEPGNVSTYLIGYANDEAAAKGAAEAWLRLHKDRVGRLEWIAEERLATGEYEQWTELVEHHEQGPATGPGICVRQRRPQ